jgi:hypothetical protein
MLCASLRKVNATRGIARLGRFVKIRQAEHLDMRFELIELMIVILSWMRDLPVDLYPGAPPSVQIRGKPATDPLNRGISQQVILVHVD